MFRPTNPHIAIFTSVAKFNAITVVDVKFSELLLAHPYADFHSRVLLTLECLALRKMDNEVEVMHYLPLQLFVDKRMYLK